MLKQKIVPIMLVILMLLPLLGGCRSAEVSQSIPASTSSIPTTAAPTTAAPTTAAPTTATQPTTHDMRAVPPGITDEHIETFYFRAFRWNQREDPQYYYFGAFDDTYAILVRDESKPYDPCWETVNGLTFYYPDGYPIFLENGESFDSFGGHLWDMFHRQLITEEQLQEIYDNYYSVYPELLYLANGQLEFGPEEMEAISQALLELTGEEVDWDDVNQYNKPRLEYYCSIMGAHVFAWIPYGHNPFPEYRTITVGSYSFTHAELFWLYVYVGGELLTLNEAYDRGFFTDAQLETISFYHYSANPVYFDN